ncbi:MAG: HAMP domain-containing protein [Chloroflexaceae bacterium]|nr:HAMP domain-containing protein [Chloroflexaceae bacterium]
MDDVTRSPTSPFDPQPYTRWRWFDWSSFGIRTKMLVPLFILMLLSILGSTIGFVISTNATRERILNRQLNDEERRVVDGLEQSQNDATEAAELLAQDDLLREALLSEQQEDGENTSLAMVDRVVPVLDRLRLDQIIVLDDDRKARVNIAPSHLESISIDGRELLVPCKTTNHQLATFQGARLLIVCHPMLAEDDQRLASVYTILDLEALLIRLQQNLELTAEVSLTDAHSVGSGSVNVETERGLERYTTTAIGDGEITVSLEINEQGADEIVASGLQVTLIASTLTLVLLLLGGFWLAQSMTRPVLKLARVAQSVGEGDLSQRADLIHNDEIGRLGRAFDKATARISDLLDHQARTAGEREAILQSIADGVLAVDMDERIVVINTAAAEILQQDVHQLTGQKLDTMITYPDSMQLVGLQQVIQQVRSELTDTSDSQPTEEQVSLGPRIVRLKSAPTLGQGGAQTGAVVVIQDVTKAVESDRAKSSFIATASHELRTPLTSLKGFADILVKGRIDNLDETQQMCLGVIKQQTDNVIVLVNELLEVARLEQGSERPRCQWVAPDVVIQESLDSLAELIAKRSVTVHVETQPEMLPIWIDALHFRRILTNLISNAVKYVYRGGQVVVHAYEIDDSALLPSQPHDSMPWKYRSQRSLLITVEDTGVGIRASDQPNIFTRFFRSENPLSVEVGGTGLGLAMTRSLIEIHKGQIGFTSVEHEGSCFWVRFPVPDNAPLEDRSTTDGQQPADEGSFREMGENQC